MLFSNFSALVCLAVAVSASPTPSDSNVVVKRTFELPKTLLSGRDSSLEARGRFPFMVRDDGLGEHDFQLEDRAAAELVARQEQEAAELAAREAQQAEERAIREAEELRVREVQELKARRVAELHDELNLYPRHMVEFEARDEDAPESFTFTLPNKRAFSGRLPFGMTVTPSADGEGNIISIGRRSFDEGEDSHFYPFFFKSNGLLEARDIEAEEQDLALAKREPQFSNFINNRIQSQITAALNRAGVNGTAASNGNAGTNTGNNAGTGTTTNNAFSGLSRLGGVGSTVGNRLSAALSRFNFKRDVEKGFNFPFAVKTEGDGEIVAGDGFIPVGHDDAGDLVFKRDPQFNAAAFRNRIQSALSRFGANGTASANGNTGSNTGTTNSGAGGLARLGNLNNVIGNRLAAALSRFNFKRDDEFEVDSEEGFITLGLDEDGEALFKRDSQFSNLINNRIQSQITAALNRAGVNGTAASTGNAGTNTGNNAGTGTTTNNAFSGLSRLGGVGSTVGNRLGAAFSRLNFKRDIVDEFSTDDYPFHFSSEEQVSGKHDEGFPFTFDDFAMTE